MKKLNKTLDALFPKSVIRDSYNNLLICYHGTPNKFDNFDTKLNIIWGSPDYDFARDYGRNILKIVFNIKNPFNFMDHSEPIGDVDYEGVDEFDILPSDELTYITDQLKLNIDDTIELLKQYYLAHREDFEEFKWTACWILWFIPEIIEHVKSLGYDGLVGIENNCDVYAAFSASQVCILKDKELKEDTRAALISKSKGVSEYKDKSRGRNRFERKKHSKVANSVRQYNQINMNNLFKSDILQVEIPVIGETDNYTVSIKMDGVIAEIQKNIKNNNNKFEFRTVIQALTKVFNTSNIYVKCTCDDYKFNYAHWNIVNNVSVDDTAHDPGAGKGLSNPKDDKGRGCKHILLVLANGDWLMKVASVINNYVHYAEEHLQKPFLKLIFPKLYGIPADEAIENDLIDDDKYLDSSKGFIDAINEYGRNRGKIHKGSNKNPVHQKELAKQKEKEEKANKDKKAIS